MRELRNFLPFLAVWIAGAGCSSAPSGLPGAPPWVGRPARTLDSGSIVYVGIGEDFTPERAKFKAESSAIQDIANECSFAPKGTRIEDHYGYLRGERYKSFAQVAVFLDECDQAKRAVEPLVIQALANLGMMDQLKHYQEAEYKTPSQVDATTPGAIQDDGGYLVAREQVAYEKELAIVNPSAYPMGSLGSRKFVAGIGPLQSRLREYELAHPGVRTWHLSWSSFERDPTIRLPNGRR